LPVQDAPDVPRPQTAKDLDAIIASTRKSVSRHVGIVRSGPGLQQALRRLRSLGRRLDRVAMGELQEPAACFDRVLRWSEARNLLPEWRRHQSLTVDRLA
jgi:aspartate oxidase